ncbi:hypothetical protein [Oceanicoccus sagamiensis]|uniref:Uncharacterized protein n=1 Tax=Oceanicoccus sagamiensis TaxID=716816 RepID=A0A1X9ND26_9GAMM|nr:hypothetical protein [Oceanicoccus sagamiensis]ARN75061.1 hypothetical protein BST96_13620 [Oceanicoccus sagamiensis]
MRVLLSTVLLFSLLLQTPLQAAEQIVSDDGREVQLNADGSWEYKSTDRFATTADGRRVRLSADGQWAYTGEKSAAGQKVVSDQKYIDEQSLDIVLSDVVIETVKGKKAPGSKNPRKKTRSVFYLTVNLDKSAEADLSATLNTRDFTVEDTDGRNYPVTAVEPDLVSIKPAGEAQITVYADGSPHWWTTKSMTVTVNKTVFASNKAISLSRPLAEAKKKQSDSFE